MNQNEYILHEILYNIIRIYYNFPNLKDQLILVALFQKALIYNYQLHLSFKSSRKYYNNIYHMLLILREILNN